MYKGIYRIALGMLLSAISASSLAQSPTPQQLEMFKNLPAEQQQALAKQYGIALPSSASSQPSTYNAPNVIQPRPAAASEAKSSTTAVTRFGLDLFAGSPTTFAPVSNVPVPADYTIGAGDEIVIQLFGKENATHRLRVNRAGTINFPSLGPMQVAGMSFSEVRDSLNQRVKEQMIGVRSDISMGEMRTMQIFVMGDAYKPGAYTVSALTTISQAIYYSGGFSDSGALRNVQLKRNGNVVRSLDMYDLLLKGDARNDVRLLPGDVVFIGPVGDTVAIKGEVNRPAIYETKPGETYQDLLEMAGGFSANAYRQQVQVKRFAATGARDIITLNFAQARDRKAKVAQGDVVTVQKQSDELVNYVQIEGDVRHPGFVEWKVGLRVADLFQSMDSAFNSTADVNYALVVREINAQRDIEVLQISLAKAILSPNSVDNLTLQSRDRVLVFNRLSNKSIDSLLQDESHAKSLEQAKQQAVEQQRDALSQGGVAREELKILSQEKSLSVEQLQRLRKNTRTALLTPVLLKLQQQSRLGLPPQIAEVTGEVKYPGRYPITDKMTVSQLLEAAGGLTFGAFTINAELARQVINTEERSTIDIQRIDLRKAIQGDANHDIVIYAQDRLNILQKPDVKIQNTVTLQGEVRFPGIYTVRQGETLGELLERAGGLTEFAHPKGAIFTREALRLQEQKLLNQYAADIRKETAKKTFRADSNMSSAISDPEKTLAFVEEASRSKALGRMVVQLNRIIGNESSADFMLEDGDFLFVPTFRNTVSIMGEVQVPITYLLDSKLDVDDYLNKAGGVKRQADEDSIFVVRADGSVYKPTSGYWFGNNKEELKAGDTIVVPLDTDYRDALSTWTAATQILYQTGVAINALK